MSDANLSLRYSQATIAGAVARLGAEISHDYKDRNPLLVGVLNGAFVFMADLVRAIEAPVEVGFVAAHSYHQTDSTGNVQTFGVQSLNVRGRHVVLVDDILDTGQTATRLMDLIGQGGPASVGLCCLLDKPSRRVVPIDADYRGLIIPGEFVVGYGLDLDQRWRNLPDIYTVAQGGSTSE